jgi:hypothetical protein
MLEQLFYVGDVLSTAGSTVNASKVGVLWGFVIIF